MFQTKTNILFTNNLFSLQIVLLECFQKFYYYLYQSLVFIKVCIRQTVDQFGGKILYLNWHTILLHELEK